MNVLLDLSFSLKTYSVMNEIKEDISCLQVKKGYELFFF